MSNNETFDEISKELRGISQGTRFCELHLPTVNGKPLGLYLAEIADRIDAAVIREREAWECGVSLAIKIASANSLKRTEVLRKACEMMHEEGDDALCEARGCPYYGEPNGCNHPKGGF